MTTLRLFRFSLVIALFGLAPLTLQPTAAAAESFQAQPQRTLIAANQTQPPQRRSQSQRVRWTPNPRMGSARSTLSGGRRGQATASCDFGKQARPTSMTLLVPNVQDGLLTAAANPSFFWHIETSKPVTAQFILSDPTKAQPVYTKTLKMTQSGVSRVDLPSNMALKVGTRYRWTVLLACREGSSGEVSARSFIERVSDPGLVRLAQGATPKEPRSSESSINQAVTFAAHGIWYDALASLVGAAQQDPKNDQLKAELRSLLSQVGQRQVELARLLEAFNPS